MNFILLFVCTFIILVFFVKHKYSFSIYFFSSLSLDSDKPETTPRIFPRTYADAMRYIEAKRRAERGKQLAENRASAGVHLRFRDVVDG
jgi:hypothetical protein